MAISCRTSILASVCCTVLTGASAAAPTHPSEQIGSWILDCSGDRPGSRSCQLRSGKRLLEKGSITGDLEIQAQGPFLVPVITLRGLPGDLLMTASLSARTEASIQFPGAAPEDLVCAIGGNGYFCAPRDSAARRVAASLPDARSVTVRVSVSFPGLNPLPTQEKSINLSGTKDALIRLRSAGPTKVPAAITVPPSQSSAGLAIMADKALKAAGYQDGLANLQNLLARYTKK